MLTINPSVKTATNQEVSSVGNKELSANNLEKLENAASQFESLFMDLMLQSMRKTVQKSGFMDGGHAEELYRSLLDSEYAKIMAQTNMTGLSQKIVEQLLQKGQYTGDNLKQYQNSLRKDQLDGNQTTISKKI